MDRFRAMEVFIEVAEAGGFARAARRLAMSPPTVSRMVGELESHLGTRLLVRTTRHVRLSENGRRYLEDARRILHDLALAEEASAGIHAPPRGPLSVTAPRMFGRMFVTPHLGEFADRHPGVRARALFVDRVVNLIEEGVDVAVRIGHLSSSTLMARKVGRVRRVTVGAPAYFARMGVPETPDDLSRHRLIRSDALAEAGGWTFAGKDGVAELAIDPRIVVNSNEAVIELLLAGRGVSNLLSYQVEPLVRAGRLRVVLARQEPPPLPVHVVHAEGRRPSRGVRAFVDFLAPRLAAEPALS